MLVIAYVSDVMRAQLMHSLFLAAVVCVTLLNRMKGDQVTTPHSTLTEYEKRPAMVVARYMLNELQRQQN